MVAEAVAVKRDGFHARGFGLFGDGVADLLRGFDVAAFVELGRHRAGFGERFTGEVVDELGVDVLAAAEDRQTWLLGAAEDSLADAGLAAGTSEGFEFGLLTCGFVVWFFGFCAWGLEFWVWGLEFGV